MDTPLSLKSSKHVEIPEMETPNISNSSSSTMETDKNPRLVLDLFEATTTAQPSVPSKRLLESLYKIAMEDNTSDQYRLANSSSGECVVLSLQDVWLPSAVYQVQKRLKAVQAKVQRDGTKNQVESVQQARLNLLEQLKSSLQVLHKQRQAREETYRRVVQQEQEQRYQEEKEQVLRQRQGQRKNHPYNQELWREVASLMTEMQKLDKEELLWDEALERLSTDLEACSTSKSTDDTDSAMQLDYDENTPMTQELGKTIQQLEDLELWTRRVRTSVAQIPLAMAQAEALRKELYQHHQNTRFKGYPGIQQPKDLLRILSQDNEANVSK